MAQIEVSVKGIEELRQRFGYIPARLPIAMGKAMGESVDLIHERISGYTQNYPPKPEGSTYERTFELAMSFDKGWTGLANKIIGWVTSNIPYAPLVMGEGRQAAIHEERWYTEQDVANETTPEVEDLFVKATKELVAQSAK